MIERSLAMVTHSVSCVLVALGASLSVAAQTSGESETATTKPAEAGGPVDEPVESYRTELLDLAFDAVSRLPTVPHEKNRSRAQDRIVAASLQIGQAERALGYIERISNWRRGSGYADLATYVAKNSRDVELVESCLDRAAEIAKDYVDDIDFQQWRVDRIRAKIARTYMILGENERAAEFAHALADSEWTEVAEAQAELLDRDAFDAQMASIDAILVNANFEQIVGAIKACTRLYDRFYTDAECREIIEQRIERASVKLPVNARIGTLGAFAQAALDHADPETARDHLDEAHALIDARQWLPDAFLIMTSRLATLRHRAGDEDEARRCQDEALARFESEREQVIDIDRADALLRAAEAYLAFGDRKAAHDVYGEAVEASVVNPNSRPRAEDLTEVCVSMATHACEPSKQLRARMQQIADDLGHPW